MDTLLVASIYRNLKLTECKSQLTVTVTGCSHKVRSNFTPWHLPPSRLTSLVLTSMQSVGACDFSFLHGQLIENLHNKTKQNTRKPMCACDVYVCVCVLHVVCVLKFHLAVAFITFYLLAFGAFRRPRRPAP